MRLGAGGRVCAVAAIPIAIVALSATCALAAFNSAVQATAGFRAYVVAAPGGLACTGLLNLASSRITWNAVAPPAEQTVDYLVTAPGGAITAVATTTYALPAIVLTPGQYAVRTRISSGWTSQASTITVNVNALGILYTCQTP